MIVIPGGNAVGIRRLRGGGRSRRAGRPPRRREPPHVQGVVAGSGQGDLVAVFTFVDDVQRQAVPFALFTSRRYAPWLADNSRTWLPSRSFLAAR